MRVEVFYFEGCPNHVPAVERMRELLREESVSAEIVETEVLDQAKAKEVRFLGSPTIKINGLDVEPAARSSRAYAIACRTYHVGNHLEGLPSKEAIRAAIREALNPSSGGHDRRAAVAAAPLQPAKEKSTSLLMAGSVFVAILASSCCILPIVFGLTGLSVVGASAAFAAWRPYLLGLTFALLGVGFYYAYRPVKAECAPGSECAMPATKRSGGLVLWLTTVIVIAFALFPYYSGPVAEVLLSGAPTSAAASSTASLQHASFAIEGMDCAACATAIEEKLKAVAGARTVRVSYEKKIAEIDFDSVASSEQFQEAIEAAGYRARRIVKGA